MKPNVTKRMIKGTILANRQIAPEHFVMDIGSAWLARKSRPGQFISVRVMDGVTDPLLRIPLGIHRISETGVSLLYGVVGPGTALLAKRKKGELIDTLGPLGKGFDLSAVTRKKNAEALLVSGGHGVAPLYALAEAVTAKKRKAVFFIGAKTGKHVVCEKALRKLGAAVHVATDDGTRGHKGYVTDMLRKYLERGARDPQRTAIFACGPKPMLAAVAKEAERSGIPAQVAYDEYMACGIGACRGCAVETVQGIKLACKDGPVFAADMIKW
ncbi:MAG: dihydroorotate dehydrogenase electron transfer subunit [Candidatus Omnitrophica bacterium]|nr:dihydroorotate dehydrogenase electron transfer subunit [Candidatus Omnitrophota bacterium]